MAKSNRLTTRQIKRRGHALIKFYNRGWRYGYLHKFGRKWAHGYDASGESVKMLISEEGRDWLRIET
ncbi:MAG: hypothetical protein CMF29_01085 [Kiritimatiellaceae bacterium]|nr:hypothetical protein [Kiritimatiellaceae bacterium]